MRIADSRNRSGPTRGNGFQEQAAPDGDDNGWIDENAASLKQFLLWTPDKTGKDTVPSLSDAGLGAIVPSRTARAFELKTNADDLLGQIRTSGIFLHEVGTAGTIQQIDLTA